MTLSAALLAATALTGFAAGHVALAQQTAPNAPTTAPAITAQNGAGAGTETKITPTEPAQTLPSFVNLVKQVSPAVVSVTSHLRASQVSDDEGGGMQSPSPSPFPFPFPFAQGPNGGPNSGQQQQAVEARGSGFIINANGTIVTNNHVVNGATRVSVTLQDGKTYPAKIVGRDPLTDLAVLKIDAGQKLPYLQLGNSNNVQVGQWVVAVGNPYGLEGTVTAGIVSALHRDIGDGPYDQFLQIDAPINRGNSGGPLFTQDGKVVGVNTAILSPSGGSIGIGFAIPSNTVKQIVADIENGGKVVRGYLGVSAQQISPSMAAALNLSSSADGQPEGALVASVQPDTPASKAGIQAGDVIMSVNGDAVKNPRDLAIDIAGVKPGDSAKLDVLREGKTQTMSVAVEALPTQTASNDRGNAGPDEANTPKLGVALAAITPDVRQELGLPDSAKGAVVAQVEPGSPADQAGIQTGDVIVGVGLHPVASPNQALQAIRQAVRGEKTVALRIMRNGQSAFVAVNLNGNQNNDDNQG